MTPTKMGGVGPFGDTTYTKVFVGGLAWETQKDTMKSYFEQFGDILEAVVIADKATGRSKGYGFVTFAEAEAAMRACVDATPVIDGRRANCNLASLGVQRSKPSTPNHQGGGRNIRVMGGGFHQAAGVGAGTAAAAAAAAFASAATFPHYPIQQGIPNYNLYGYSPFSAEYAYPTSYYGVYGGGNAQYPLYGSGNNGLVTGTAAAAAAYYPNYLNFNEGSGGTTAYSATQGCYGVHYPHHLFQYSPISSTGIYPPHYGTPVSLAPTTPLQSAGLTMTMHAPPIPHR
ncbi:hypothetical protein CASFOL_016487 [Castilleja foliolosa]|uniref:RRM domain-containing protein n=1 Tax=Castilleja foliolosa TaxID=1961234 RepID=A0ABD3DI47_9LAMI